MPRYDNVVINAVCPYCGVKSLLKSQSRSISTPEEKTLRGILNRYFETYTKSPCTYLQGGAVGNSNAIVDCICKCNCGGIFTESILVMDHILTDEKITIKGPPIQDDIQQQAIFIETVIDVVCGKFKINPVSLLDKSRKREIVYSRYFIWRQIKKAYPMSSLHFLGGILGKDHATAYHGLCKAEEILGSGFDKEMIKMYDSINEILFGEKVNS